MQLISSPVTACGSVSDGLLLHCLETIQYDCMIVNEGMALSPIKCYGRFP